MLTQFSRTELLLGSEAMQKLQSARVAVFGIGGVGSYVVEALARSGVGTLELIDNDTVALTNLNRQLMATHATIGQPKVEAMAARVRSINPEAIIHTHQVFFLPKLSENSEYSDNFA